MAVEILRGDVIHDARHDLESFYWLLVWLVLRHTDHDHAAGNLACSRLFDGDDEWDCDDHKGSWFIKPQPLGVRGNVPLTYLLAEFKSQCLYNILHHQFIPIVPLTHESVLAAFDKALAMDGWPENDAARPYKMLNTTATRVDARPPPQSTDKKTGSKPPSSRSKPPSAVGRLPRSQCGPYPCLETGSLVQERKPYSKGQVNAANSGKPISRASQSSKCTTEHDVRRPTAPPMIPSTNSWSFLPSAPWSATDSVAPSPTHSYQTSTVRTSPTSGTKRTRDEIVEKENHSPSKRRKSAGGRPSTFDGV